MKLSKK